MFYTSTRDDRVRTSAAGAIARGISAEGGLFVPGELPRFGRADWEALLPLSYTDRAARVLAAFLEDFTPEETAACAAAAYGSGRFEGGPAPVKQVGDAYLLELWHGPTCAFKDLALQILPHLMGVSAQKTAPGREIVILVATSGDTGKAALEGFRDVKGTRILVFYPDRGVSPMQKLQMVTQEGANLAVCAIRGNFDHAQSGVKTIFTDPEVTARLAGEGLQFSSANSINWGRLAPQIVYYVSAYCDLVDRGILSLGDPVNVAVPTGNFGNILAAWYAREMGLPVSRLICASNRNRVLTDFLTTGTYDRNRAFYTTTSPSMDILISSNLERLLWHLSGEDHRLVAELMASLRTGGRYTVPDAVRQKIQALFAAGSCTDEEAAAAIRDTWQRQGYLLDPHTAVAVKVYRDYRESTGDTTPTLIASTADPYKFSAPVLAALGAEETGDEFRKVAALRALTGRPVPAPLADLQQKQVRFTGCCDPDPASMREAVYRLLRIG